jgi:ABC-type branched-subunit amino acid transport system ATPase component
LPTPSIANAGIGYVPESMAVFSDLSVKENLVLAARSGPIDETRLEWIFGFFTGFEEILAVARRDLVRRSKANAVDRPRDDRRAQTPSHR